MERQERRRYVRQAADKPAYIIAGREVYSCKIKDLSEGGFFVETGAMIQAGAEISMVYQSFDDKKETKSGRIVRLAISGIGGKFELPGS